MSEQYKIQSRSICFTGSSGYRLAASLDFPRGMVPQQYIIISHCFTCTKQTLTTARLSRGLAMAGLAVLRFDFTGLGDSEGSFADSHFHSMVRDIECAAAFLSEHYQPASFLIGHSMGGTACLAAVQNGNSALSGVQKVVTIASPAYPAHLLHHFGPAMSKLQQGEDAEIIVAGQSYPVKPQFVEDVQSYEMDEQMAACKIPIMALTAGNDELIGPQAAKQILGFTQGDTKLIEVAEADHLFTQRDHAQQLLTAVIDWIQV